MAAQDAHDKKLQKSLQICEKEGIHFVPLAWESLGCHRDGTRHAEQVDGVGGCTWWLPD